MKKGNRITKKVPENCKKTKSEKENVDELCQFSEFKRSSNVHDTQSNSASSPRLYINIPERQHILGAQKKAAPEQRFIYLFLFQLIFRVEHKES